MCSLAARSGRAASAVLDAVAEQLARRARRPRPSQPVRSSQARSSIGLSKNSHLLDLEPGGVEERAPLGLGVVAHVRRVAELLGLLDVVAHERGCRPRSRAPRATRAISVTAAPTSSKWCAATRQATTSKLASANGRCSARQITSGCMPGAGSHVTTVQPGLAQPPRHVAAAGRDVERRHPRPRLGPLDEPGRDRRPRGARRSSRYGSARSFQMSLIRSPAPPRAARRRASSARRWMFGARGLGEQAPALLGVRAVEPDDDRLRSCPSRSSACEDPARDLVAARDPAEDVEEDRAHLRVARDHLERVDDALARCRRRRGRRSSPAARRRARRRPPSTSRARRRCRGSRRRRRASRT